MKKFKALDRAVAKIEAKSKGQTPTEEPKEPSKLGSLVINSKTCSENLKLLGENQAKQNQRSDTPTSQNPSIKQPVNNSDESVTCCWGAFTYSKNSVKGSVNGYEEIGAESNNQCRIL